MIPQDETRQALQGLLRQAVDLSTRLNADILLYNGAIYEPAKLQLLAMCKRRQRRRNVFLIITTLGGSADAAYWIASCLQNQYSGFSAYIRGVCKSAGTLLISGAETIIMPDDAELGPLDVQVYKPDELGERSSGVALTQALQTLQERSFELFEYHFLNIRTRSLYQISTKIALETASHITTGLMSPIYAQIDPMRLGELERATRIALEYGRRLGGQKFKTDGLEKLISGYPSHECVIDRTEAQQIFNNVRPPAEDEEALVEACDIIVNSILDDDNPASYLDELLNDLLSSIEEENGDVPTDHDPEGEDPPGDSGDGEGGNQPSESEPLLRIDNKSRYSPDTQRDQPIASHPSKS